MLDLKSLVGSIEHKVTAATVGSYVAGLVGLYATGAANDISVLSFLPDWAKTLVAPLVPAVVALASGYSAPHTPRGATVPDLPVNLPASPVDPLTGP